MGIIERSRKILLPKGPAPRDRRAARIAGVLRLLGYCLAVSLCFGCLTLRSVLPTFAILDAHRG